QRNAQTPDLDGGPAFARGNHPARSSDLSGARLSRRPGARALARSRKPIDPRRTTIRQPDVNASRPGSPTFLIVCRNVKPLNGPDAIGGRARQRRRKRANLSAKRYIT